MSLCSLVLCALPSLCRAQQTDSAMQDAQQTAADPYLWLEDVGGDKALDWVRAQNADSHKALVEDPRFEGIRSRLLSILDSTARIPYVQKHGSHCYNFWQDAQNPRGLWRRTTLDEFRKDSPQWEVVLDLDALGKQEGENWVFKGTSWLSPENRRVLVQLSRGGADAVVVREFDVQDLAFVDGGFSLPEAKCSVAWRDRDSLFVGTDFGPGSLTSSGYPRIVKLWRRGAPLDAAETIYEGKETDVFAYGYRDLTRGFERDFVYRGATFFTNQVFWRSGEDLVPIEKPDSANASVHREWLLLELREDWEVGGKSYKAGSLLASRFDGYMGGARDFAVLFEPTERSSLSGFSGLKNCLLLSVLDNVKTRVFVLRHGPGGWTREPLPGLPEFGTVSASAVDEDEGDAYWLTMTDYLTPTSLLLGEVGKGEASRMKSLPAFFDATKLQVEQREAMSKDGTFVPYFLVTQKDAPRDGSNPTLLYGYGGFEVSLTPSYSAGVGASWLEQGGCYAVANIRGGGEFGPRWHQAALKQNRNKAYEDFAAVAEDLIAQKITSPEHLGIQGGSNGGLLMGNMTVMYPELFAAVVCQVPLLDMLRYHKLLAGASWMGEYGDPDDPEEARWLRRYSPYHTVAADVRYPQVLFTTSTRDDRVHPGHARKMFARMKEQGHQVLYYENIEGGHGGAADNKQAAFLSALAYTFLHQKLR